MLFDQREGRNVSDPKVLSFPWISKGFRALTFGLWRFEKQKAFSARPSPSKGLIGAFEEAVKGDPWRAGPDDLTILRERTIAEKDAQLAEAEKQLAAAKAIIASDTKQIAEIHAMVERRVTELLASNNALLERARRAEAALRPFIFDLEGTKEDNDQVALLTCKLGHLRAAASVIAQIEGSAP